MKKHISFRIEELIMNKFKDKIKKEGRTVTGTLLMLIKKYLEK